VLRYAEELTQKAQVDDDLYRQVQERLGQKEVIELTAATAFWNMMARNLNALQVELEPASRNATVVRGVVVLAIPRHLFLGIAICFCYWKQTVQ